MDSHTENNLRQSVQTSMELLAQARARIAELEDALRKIQGITWSKLPMS